MAALLVALAAGDLTVAAASAPVSATDAALVAAPAPIVLGAAARTARVQVGRLVYAVVVPPGQLTQQIPTVFATLAAHVAVQSSVAPLRARVMLLGAEPIFTPASAGRRVTPSRVLAALAESLRTHRVVNVPMTPVAAPRAGVSTESVIVVHAGENMLYLYEHGVLSRTFPVATGSPDFPTPKGRFSIQWMRYLPTWINPHPTTGWGLSMPAKILPGPLNPLGLRAMNLTAPNIRIHGTPHDSSVGYSVSHGCIRMHNSDVVQLFALVSTGTTVFIVQTAPPKLPRPGSGIETAIDPTQGG